MAQQRPSGAISNATPENRIGYITAQIGSIVFNDAFSDPDVTISHDRETAEHEVVTGHTAVRDNGVEFIVQALGRNSPSITVTGWLTEQQLDTADSLVSTEYVPIITGRWMGTGVVQDVNIEYSRVYHPDAGWVFETTFKILGVNKGIFPSDANIRVSELVNEEPRVGFPTVETETLADEKEERREAIDDALESRGYDPDDEQSDDSDSELNIEYNPGDTFT